MDKVGIIERMRERNIKWDDIGYFLNTTGDAARMCLKKKRDIEELGEKPIIKNQSYTENATGPILTRRYFCKHNPEHVYETSIEKFNHMRVCDNNPKKAELNLLRKRNVSITCDCGKVFVRKDSLNKHKKRQSCNG